ncbi:MAG: hypothetical protein RSD95_02795 [Clostridia bacterium]
MNASEAKAMAEFYSNLLGKLCAAKIALVEGRVKSYTIDDRSLTRFDLDTLSGEIDDAVRKKAEYEAIASGQRPRKAFGVVPRNW